MFGKKDIPQDRKEELLNKIRPIIAQQLGISEDKIVLSAKITEDLGADSLDTIELTMALEEEFKIEILDEDAEKMKTIEDIVIYLAGKVQT